MREKKRDTQLIPPRKRTFLPEKEERDTHLREYKTVALYIRRGQHGARCKAKPERIHVRIYLLFSKRRGHVSLGHAPRTISRLNYSVRRTVCPSAVFIKREPESAAGELILAPCLSLPARLLRACIALHSPVDKPTKLRMDQFWIRGPMFRTSS